MDRQYPDPNYQSGYRQSGHHQSDQRHGQTSYPYTTQQHATGRQHSQSLPMDPYSDRAQGHHGLSSSYPQAEGLLHQHSSSGQGYGGHSPYAGNISFPNPQHEYGGSTSHHQAPVSFPQTTPHLTVPTTHHQHDRRSSHSHSPTTGSFSDSQRSYPAGGSLGLDIGGRSNHYSSRSEAQPHQVGDYPILDEGHERLKAPPNRFVVGRSRPTCRFPRCNNPVYYDGRINDYREWCGEQHMQAAISHGVEKPCRTCQVWPRLYGFKYCSGDMCRNPYR